MSKYLDYAKTFNGNNEIQFWITHNLGNFLKDNPENQDEIEHIIDYLIGEDAPTRLKSMSYDEAKKNAEKWTKTQQKKGQHIKEKPEDTEVVLDFKDGFKIVELVGRSAYQREGYLMRHCVASYYGNSSKIYSLRDKDNNPHATLEDGQQVKGKGNGDIHPRYVEYVVKFLEFIGMTVGDNEMEHLGYANMEKFKKELSKDTKYFNKVYLPENEKLIDRSGREFASLDLWDVRPLVVEQGDSLKINFELPTFIKLSFERIWSSGKIGSANKVGKISSGDSAKNASSGHYAKNASSGHSAKNASSGHSATNASSGDSAKNASSGHSATNASSGDYAKNASSGHYAKNASSGHSATNASSGDYAKNASSGDSAKNAMEGNYSVSVDAGHDGRAKGKIGSWFCLSEWEKDTEDDIWKPICVKAVQIDGKKIKEDTWYMLKKGKFVEAK